MFNLPSKILCRVFNIQLQVWPLFLDFLFSTIFEFLRLVIVWLIGNCEKYDL